MRRLLLSLLSLPVLLAATFLLWQNKIEQVPGTTSIQLSDLRKHHPKPSHAEWSGTNQAPILRLDPAAISLSLPEILPCENLHLIFEVEATNIAPGPNPWDDGRLLLEWRPITQPGEIEIKPLTSARGRQKIGPLELVAHPANYPATPLLRIENLGQKGEFKIIRFEATAVQPTLAWRVGKWPLIASWLGFFAWIARFHKCRWRALLVGCIWLIFAMEFILPGPWEFTRPLVIGFDLGSKTLAAASTTASQTVSEAEEETNDHHPSALDHDSTAPQTLPSPSVETVRPSGKIPTRGDPFLRLKSAFPHIRPLLHILMMCLPTLASLLLIQRRTTLGLALAISFGIEIAQSIFGFGFDSADILDLLWNAVGIILAILLHARITRYLRKKRPNLQQP